MGPVALFTNSEEAQPACKWIFKTQCGGYTTVGTAIEKGEAVTLRPRIAYDLAWHHRNKTILLESLHYVIWSNRLQYAGPDQQSFQRMR